MYIDRAGQTYKSGEGNGPPLMSTALLLLASTASESNSRLQLPALPIRWPGIGIILPRLNLPELSTGSWQARVLHLIGQETPFRKGNLWSTEGPLLDGRLGGKRS